MKNTPESMEDVSDITRVLDELQVVKFYTCPRNTSPTGSNNPTPWPFDLGVEGHSAMALTIEG